MIENVAGIWMEEVDGVLIQSAKKTAVLKAVKKLREPFRSGTSTSRVYNGWTVNWYQFGYFYKADIYDSSGSLSMSYTQKTKSLLLQMAMSYLMNKGVIS